ncbi:MAG: hypothetical protein EXR52_07785 [Dehalococcoidia bacterium]|nr:hypothetical protein [Dehalococcoidia bacterium]
MTTGPDISSEDISLMARVLGLSITPADLPEVTHRVTALLDQLQRLDGLDLESADPSAIFPKEAGA